MPPAKEGSFNSYLIGIGLVADVLGILGFVGLKVNNVLAIVLVSSLSMCGLVAAIVVLWNSISGWLSIRGSFYPPGHHVRRIVLGLVTLILAVALGVGLMVAYFKQQEERKSENAPVQATISSTPK